MGNAFVPRTDDELEFASAKLDAAVAVGAGLVASAAVSPFLVCVDRAVVAHAAGASPNGSLLRGISRAAGEFILKPKVAFSSPALWMVAGVYGATYAAANLSDVVGERTKADDNTKTTAKFVATTAANSGGSIMKDAAFARMFGAAAGAGAVAAAAGKACPLVVPPASYALFLARDCLTIGGAFIMPTTLAETLTRRGVAEGTAGNAAQFAAPPLMQLVCTPIHLLALNLVNSPGARLGERAAALARAGPSAFTARSLRMVPAYSVGGVLNKKLVEHGRAAVLRMGREWRGVRAWREEVRKRREQAWDAHRAAAVQHTSRIRVAFARIMPTGASAMGN